MPDEEGPEKSCMLKIASESDLYSVSISTVEPALVQITGHILREKVGTHNAGIWGNATDRTNRLL